MYLLTFISLHKLNADVVLLYWSVSNFQYFYFYYTTSQRKNLVFLASFIANYVAMVTRSGKKIPHTGPGQAKPCILPRRENTSSVLPLHGRHTKLEKVYLTQEKPVKKRKQIIYKNKEHLKVKRWKIKKIKYICKKFLNEAIM